MTERTPDAYDGEGNPLFLQDWLTVCPVEFLEGGREACAWHLTHVENEVETPLEKMLPTPIGPVGGDVTHHACYRQVYPSCIASVNESMAALSTDRPWMKNGQSQIDDPEALTKFACLSCSLDAFLAAHSMEVKA